MARGRREFSRHGGSGGSGFWRGQTTARPRDQQVGNHGVYVPPKPAAAEAGQRSSAGAGEP